MRYIVVETFRGGDPEAAGRRFRECGRMLPDGLVYMESWMSASGKTCFQLMETQDPSLLEVWASRWDDLVAFEFVPVEPSTEYWKKRASTP